MNSKEALNNIIKTSCPQRTICEECVIKNSCNSFAKDWIDTIKNDLEVLEILKRNALISKNGEGYIISIWLNTENCDFENCESFEKIEKVKERLTYE